MSSRRSRKAGVQQADHVEPVVQVLAKPAGANQGLQVLVGGRQDADVDRDRLRAADALERHLLEHAQQLGLDLEVDVADLVEEERAAVGLFEPAHAVAVGAGERTLDVAEELAFEQALRQGGAVDLDERPCRAGTGLMDRRGQQFLARAALAPDQHGRGTRPRPCGPCRSSCGRPRCEPLIDSKTPEVAARGESTVCSGVVLSAE